MASPDRNVYASLAMLCYGGEESLSTIMDTDNQRRMVQMKELIQQTYLFLLGGCAMYIFSFLMVHYHPGGILSAMAGAALSARIVARPETLPPAWMPRASGFENDVAQEKELRLYIFGRVTPSMRRTARARIYSVLSLGALCLPVTALLHVALIPDDLFFFFVLLLCLLIAGIIIGMAVAWLSIYKQVLNTLEL